MSNFSPASLARLRAGVYAALAEALLPPSGQRIGGLLKPSQPWTLHRAGSYFTIPGWAAATDAYGDVLASARAMPRQSLLEELTVEYCRLFVGPGKLRCPPYESVHQDRGAVMGPSTYAVLRTYHQADYHPVGAQEPPDHIAYELQFMRRLCSREVGLWQAGDVKGLARVLAIESRFQQEHLCRWVPAFCAVLRRMSRHAFYRAVSDLLSPWVVAEASVPPAWLMVLPNETAAPTHLVISSAHA